MISRFWLKYVASRPFRDFLNIFRKCSILNIKLQIKNITMKLKEAEKLQILRENSN